MAACLSSIVVWSGVIPKIGWILLDRLFVSISSSDDLGMYFRLKAVSNISANDARPISQSASYSRGGIE